MNKTEKRNLNILSNLVIKNFDNLLKANKKIIKQWNKKTVPLTLLKKTIEISKFKNPEPNNKLLIRLEESHHEMMDLIYSTCENAAKRMNLTDIPYTILENCVYNIKTAFIEELEKEINKLSK